MGPITKELILYKKAMATIGELESIFGSEPKIDLSEETKKSWHKLGPIDVRKMIYEKKLSLHLDKRKKVDSVLAVGIHKIDHEDSVLGQIGTTIEYDSMSNFKVVPCAQGICRQVQKLGSLYEG